jgi:oxygen-independent coproporphyrinogen-3 oxidase
MAGLYIHIPFCKQKCHYCNFYSIASVRNKSKMVEAIVEELRIASNYLEDESLKTIYFGGGTPSLLDEPELNSIFDSIYKHFRVETNAEITLEANPDDLNTEKAILIKNTPVNRLSIGIQSFHDDDLLALNRIHTSQQAIDVIRNMQDAGMTNISIDLIYGIPGLTDNKWQQNLDTFRQLSLPHLSAYALTVEAHTTLAWLIKKGRSQPVNEEQSINQFKILQGFAAQHGYEQYEISNFSLPGMYSKHNSAYWSGEKYLGIGPAAHSFNGNSRRWNVANSMTYINAIGEGKLCYEEEILTEKQKFNEYLLTSLRTIQGCDLSFIEKRFGVDYRENIEKAIAKNISSGKYILRNNNLILTPEGMLFADGLASDLFLVDE